MDLREITLEYTAELFGQTSGWPLNASFNSGKVPGIDRFASNAKSINHICQSPALLDPGFFQRSHGMTSCLDIGDLDSAHCADYLQAKSAQDALRNTQPEQNIPLMEIGDVIRQARKKKGLTLEQLAHQVGTDTGNLSRLERGKQGASQELLSKLLGALGLSLSLAQTDQSNADPGPSLTTPFRSVKIAGTAQLGAEGYWTALSPGDGHVDIPTKDKDAYALRLRGDSMSPAIRSGWVAVCEPNSQLIPGEYVHIKLKGFDGDGESMVKELLYANDEEISVMSINDAFGRRTLALAEIEYIHPVPFIVAPSKIVQ